MRILLDECIDQIESMKKIARLLRQHREFILICHDEVRLQR